MPTNATLRGFIVVGLLLTGVLVVYLPQLSPKLFGQAMLRADDQLTYIADLDFWKRTDRETAVVATTHFDLNSDLSKVPLNVGGWQGVDVPETNREVIILLDPEQYVQRLYHNDAGQYVWLSLIGGRSSQPFHAPDICYDADGWQYNLGSQPVELAEGGELYGLWLDAKKRMPGDNSLTEQIVFYFYLFPNRARDLADGIVLFKLTSAPYGSVKETLAVQADFVRHLFTSAQ